MRSLNAAILQLSLLSTLIASIPVSATAQSEHAGGIRQDAERAAARLVTAAAAPPPQQQQQQQQQRRTDARRVFGGLLGGGLGIYFASGEIDKEVNGTCDFDAESACGYLGLAYMTVGVGLIWWGLEGISQPVRPSRTFVAPTRGGGAIVHRRAW